MGVGLEPAPEISTEGRWYRDTLYATVVLLLAAHGSTVVVRRYHNRRLKRRDAGYSFLIVYKSEAEKRPQRGNCCPQGKLTKIHKENDKLYTI